MGGLADSRQLTKAEQNSVRMSDAGSKKSWVAPEQIWWAASVVGAGRGGGGTREADSLRLVPHSAIRLVGRLGFEGEERRGGLAPAGYIQSNQANTTAGGPRQAIRQTQQQRLPHWQRQNRALCACRMLDPRKAGWRRIGWWAASRGGRYPAGGGGSPAAGHTQRNEANTSTGGPMQSPHQ